MPPDNEENVEGGTDALCGLCGEKISTQSSSYCNGAESHYLCYPCFCGYAMAACEPTGSFERVITGGDDGHTSSEPGELPCYRFATRECGCAAIPPTVIARSLSTDPQALCFYEDAKRRLIAAEQERVRQEAERAQAEARELETPADRLRNLVADTLSKGGRVKCPQCGISSLKDDACMHMICVCNTSFCYCCGRARGEGDGECTRFGCDIQSPYLENHPGWEDCAVADENDGEGALNEFHRQCMVYFLRLVKERTQPNEWSHLRQKYPEMLQDVPTEGRHIDWDEIDGADPPLFGTTELSDLKWVEDFVQEIEDSGRITPGGADEHVEDGLLCGLCDSNVPATASSCSGSEPHFLCDKCFCSYAMAECEPTGAFEGERRGGESGDMTSAPGELPCYLFATGECSCTSIPATSIARALSTDAGALDRYLHARNRLNAAQAKRDQQEARAAQSNAEERSTPVDRLRNVVREALNRGGGVECPDCGVRGQKNDACMHMTCICGRSYCYCCGRGRGGRDGECPSDGFGCDSPCPYLENHPGWGNLAIGGETAGMGALHEYHRRRMMYFLRQVKEQSDPRVWTELRRRDPNLLHDVPTEGRRIDWDSIDQATPPLFGRTLVHQLAWAGEGLGAREAAERMEQHANGQGDEERREVATVKEYLSEHRWIVYVWLIAFAVALVVFIVRQAAADSSGLRVFGNTLIALLAATGLSALVLHVIDERRANGLAYRLNEVQCFGRRGGELPYLSAAGRWNRRRFQYWLIFFGSISLGSLLVGMSRNVVTNNLAMERALKFVGTTILCCVLLLYGGMTFLVNRVPQPREPVDSWYRRFLVCMCVYVGMFSMGVGLHAAFDADTAGREAAQCFLLLGFAGFAAEATPRSFSACRQNLPFLRPVDPQRLGLNYFFFGGAAIGSLLVGLSQKSSLNTLGIVIILAALLGSCVHHSCAEPSCLN